jgi:hypothetical protein
MIQVERSNHRDQRQQVQPCALTAHITKPQILLLLKWGAIKSMNDEK